MTDQPIYLDYMATTPVDPRVVEKMVGFMGPDGGFGNPASVTHKYGRTAAIAVEDARTQVARAVGAQAEEIVFTSGATESNNLAILGSARFYCRKGRHLITMTTEHKTVLAGFQQLEREGFEVTYLNPDVDGLLNLAALEAALRPDTILLSVMLVNNETGVVQDIEKIGNLLKNRGIIFHVDAAQAAGKLPLNLSSLEVSLMSFSAHKNYGPKGVGALYVRQKPRIRLQALSFGGGQENGLRSGTLPTHQIVGMGEAFELAEQDRVEEQARILKLRQKLWHGLQNGLEGIALNGHETHRIPGNLNFRVQGLDGASLFYTLSELAVSTTSACMSAASDASHVLKALGLSDQAARSSIRVSLGRFTTEAQVNEAIQVLCEQITRNRTRTS